MKTCILVTCLTLALGLLSCRKELSPESSTIAQQQNSASTAGSSAPAASAGEILVKFKPNQMALDKIGTLKRHLFTHAMQRAGDSGLYVMQTNLPLEKIRALSEVAYAEPNYRYHVDEVSNDTYFMKGYLYGLSGAYSCNADQAWAADHVGSSSVVVGIIDEGIFSDHEDLKANIWTNPFDPVNGVDDDGNGYIDDIHGWNFINDNNQIFTPLHDAHGTHVAGTLGAEGGNRLGVVGVNWNVTMISAKFLDETGTTEDAIRAIDYITDLKLRHGLNIVATNNSWGGPDNSLALKEAIDRAGQANILFVAAAGNDAANNDARPHYPSSFDNANIISVAAINKWGDLAEFSNFGMNSVDIGAMGDFVYSTLPDYSKWKGSKNPRVVSGYNFESGTSMACPHVTGAAALYSSTHPGATAAQIKSAILSSVISTTSLQGKCITGGRLNVSNF